MEACTITFEFVDSVPAEREEGKIYISTKYRTAIHSCLCGCGLKVVTPLRPAKWRLLYDGDTVSLSPSVGNWSFPCRSHYVIRNNVAHPAGDQTDAEVAAGRRRDHALADAYYGRGAGPSPPASEPVAAFTPPVRKKRGFLARLFGSK